MRLCLRYVKLSRLSYVLAAANFQLVFGMVKSSASSSRHGSWRLHGVDVRQEVSKCHKHDGVNSRTVNVVHRQQEIPQPDRATLVEVLEEM